MKVDELKDFFKYYVLEDEQLDRNVVVQMPDDPNATYAVQGVFWDKKTGEMKILVA